MILILPGDIQLSLSDCSGSHDHFQETDSNALPRHQSESA